MARAAAASAGTTEAGQGIAQRRRCVSQCASPLSATANAVSRASRAPGISGMESLYSCRTASSTRESSRPHAAGASARSCTRSSGRRPPVHSKKTCAGCSCPRWQSRQGRNAARGKSCWGEICVSEAIDTPEVGPFGAAQYAPTLYRVWMPVKERLAQGDKPQRGSGS